MATAPTRAPGDETRRSREAQQVKDRILDAAIPLFARGFDSVAVQQIAEASGSKHSLVMYHFGTKERLWEQAAERLMRRFDQRHREHFEGAPKPGSDRATLRLLLLAFVLALREQPAYGQMLLSEGMQVSPRLAWLHRNFFPSVFRETRFRSARLRDALSRTTLLRSALVGGLLYPVVAAPQIAQAVRLEGRDARAESELPSEAAAGRLAEMMTAFVMAQVAAG